MTNMKDTENKDDPWTSDSASAKNAATQNETSEKKKQENDGNWEKDVINRLAFAAINEQRRSRRWNIFFKSLFFIYLIGIFYLYTPSDTKDLKSGPHTALVDISGPIADDAAANANSIAGGLRDAFKHKNTKAIVLRINSPGGSPVQAGYINDEVYRLKEKYPDIPVYAVVTDMCASAAYYIAVSADKIYANKASIVGSIGVLMNGFGFEGTMEKLGVERRLMTAGENKGFLDPFSPVSDTNKKHMQSLLDNVHTQFIDVVKKGRGDKLVDNPDIFSGLFWSGDKSLELGLIDGLGSAGFVAREVIGEENIVDFTPRPNYLDRFAEKLGIAGAKAMSVLFSSSANLQ